MHKAKLPVTPETNANPPVDLKPQIAKRAYEIHEKEGNKKNSAGQDWAKAEGEIRNNKAGAATKPDEIKTESEPEKNAAPDNNEEANQEDKAGSKPDEVKAALPPEEKNEPEAKTEANPENMEATAAKANPEAKEDTPANLTPQLVKRVHELYEQLGREEVQAVEDLEKAKSATEKHK
jgi:hypothetical protein